MSGCVHCEGVKLHPLIGSSACRMKLETVGVSLQDEPHAPGESDKCHSHMTWLAEETTTSLQLGTFTMAREGSVVFGVWV